ncbi:hypothetical protein ACFSW8_03085 [Rubritalea tangerina]|uniref:Uncharacterized protein n=2 Tax=Rubritalea tangerina TaxID=430798 RepID=A0ABW4Z7E6_9BACT
MNDMVKRMTGLFLLSVMAVAIAMELPVLKFCLCQDKVVLASCDCEEEAAVVSEATCGSCCGAELVRGEQVCETRGLSQDCIVTLDFDLGEYTPFSVIDQVVTVEHSLSPPQWREHGEAMVLPTVLKQENPARGSPPDVGGGSLPVYKRVEVFLI